VEDVLRRLDRQGWPNKSDIGWSEYDVEIYGSRWSQVQLTTVAEEHPQGKQLLRCRLRSSWSFPAQVAFWSLCGFELLLFGFVGAGMRWWWWVLLLSTLPLFAWFLHSEKRNLQSMVAVFLDRVAKEWELTKVHPDVKAKPAEPVGEAPSSKLQAPEKLQVPNADH
jgi:hypothetical protein